MDNKEVVDHANACLAVEDMLKCDVISPETRRHLAKLLELLDAEGFELLQKHLARLRADRSNAA